MENLSKKQIEVLSKFCTPEKLDACVAYCNAIMEINKSVNLTAIKDFDSFVMLHLEDSLSALPELEACESGEYIDIGCGGGFPGVPLGIVTKRKTTLLDSTKKKIDAVSNALSKLDFDTSNFSPIASRIEDFGGKNCERFSAVSARALSTLPTLLELASPLLKIGGCLIALKSHIDEEEEQWADSLEGKLGLRKASKREFYLSDGETFRTIVVYEKFKQPDIKLPRKNGLAQKRPIKI